MKGTKKKLTKCKGEKNNNNKIIIKLISGHICVTAVKIECKFCKLHAFVHILKHIWRETGRHMHHTSCINEQSTEYRVHFKEWFFRRFAVVVVVLNHFLMVVR